MEELYTKKPLIGVIPLVDNERKSLWMIPGYMDGIITAGGIPTILPLTEDDEILNKLFELYDGFLFTGGQDVSPKLYGEKSIFPINDYCEKRDTMEGKILNMAIAHDKPILGICRGIQFINAALGGSLYQDLPTQRKSEVQHCQKPPYDRSVHRVDIAEGTPLHKLLGKTSLNVNSYHHQAVKSLSPKLKPMAYSQDGLVEAVYIPENRYIWAVQWHPELSYKVDRDSVKIFKSFLDAAKL